MNLVAKDGAIASIALIPDEVRPLEGFYLPALLRAIAERYELAKSPSIEDAKTIGAKFQTGRLAIPSGQINITELAIFNDALSVTTTDTSDSEFVLDDFFKWLQQTAHFRQPITPPIRIFQSDLVIKFDNDPNEAFDGIALFLNLIQKQMTTANVNTKKPVEFSRIAFGTDPGSPEFTVERRIGVPWHLKMYFSKAHLRTNEHIAALELLDELLQKKR